MRHRFKWIIQHSNDWITVELELPQFGYEFERVARNRLELVIAEIELDQVRNVPERAPVHAPQLAPRHEYLLEIEEARVEELILPDLVQPVSSQVEELRSRVERLRDLCHVAV